MTVVKLNSRGSKKVNKEIEFKFFSVFFAFML